MEKMFTGGGSQNDSRAREWLTRCSKKDVAKVCAGSMRERMWLETDINVLETLWFLVLSAGP